MTTRNFRKLATWQAVAGRRGYSVRLVTRTKAHHYWQAYKAGVIVGFFLARYAGTGHGTLPNR